MASSSSVSVFDNHRFKTAFNEELYNTILKNKKVIAECCIDLDEDEYPEVKEQISLREEEMEEAGEHTFRSFVRGVPVDFSPGNIETVMRFRTQVQGAATDSGHKSMINNLIESEIPVIRAILIHCIMRGEDVRAEDIIADKIVRMAQGIKEKGKLGFPSTIYKLCKEAGVPLREFRRTRKIQAEKPITARRMESTRLPRPVQQR
ncbi:hypothetical protein PIB30_097241 [Stylosanthes scabra]|uniref:Putative plant transposon protein domain-containing protein n=1 Tax=Stylosanthes scabra TaxID=79078 RepID=A0ABU6QVM1_9FABA|nr:hypothetical protein [Stylosanthes scabra]